MIRAIITIIIVGWVLSTVVNKAVDSEVYKAQIETAEYVDQF